MSNPTKWKTPDEVIRLHRLKQRTKALTARLDRPSQTATDDPPRETKKRKNPFVDKRSAEDVKKPKLNSPEPTDAGSEDSIFQFLTTKQEPKSSAPTASLNQKSFANPALPGTTIGSGSSYAPKSFTNFIAPEANDDDAAENVEEQKPSKFLPIDWSLKSRLRLLTLTRIAGNGLKTCQEASGITSFVRCLNPSSSSTGLDISPGARFHQATLYWQHPHLPWLTLFPRNAKANSGFTLGDTEKAALASDWTSSFRSLFQQLRARQCPYFYLCSNSFNVLFRAAGIGGRVETHAFLTPTTRGMRAALKQEEIEFTMPLKNLPTENGQQNKSLDSGIETQSTSFSNFSDDATQDATEGGAKKNNANDDHGDDDDDDDDEDQEQWLASLGVEAAEIKKISSIHARSVRNAECEDDFSDHSIVLIEGVECQAFFNFLLTSKSTIPKTGRLAGIPPTLLAPVAFPGASLRSLFTRATKIRMDGTDYQSMEMKGVVLPHVLPYLCALLRESKDTFSASMASQPDTVSFSKASQRIIEDLNKENHDKSTSDHVFGRENLSDCGLPATILEAFCRCSNDAVQNLERMCFNKEMGGYTWN